MNSLQQDSFSLAAQITRDASKQTYYTIRLLADRQRAADAYRAYAYFRWLDDILDEEAEFAVDRRVCLSRQQALLEACYQGVPFDDLCAEEKILADLIANDREKNSGLQVYLRNMMGVMVFDCQRRGQVISQAELAEYTQMLASAVSEAIYYFIGHDDPVPLHPARYLSVTAAHITHMLRDAFEDSQTGYLNIPIEYLQAKHIEPDDIKSPAYREWVYRRIQLAHSHFQAGREYIAQTPNFRRRLAGFAYTARFEWVLHAIEQDNYLLRPDYPERKHLKAGLWMVRFVLGSLLASYKQKTGVLNPASTLIGIKDQ